MSLEFPVLDNTRPSIAPSLENSAVAFQAHIRGYLSRKQEACIQTQVLTSDNEGNPTAKVIKYVGKLGYISKEENDKDVKTAFTVVAVKKTHASINVISNGTQLFFPSGLDTSPISNSYNGSVMINGGFFEMLKPNTTSEGKCYGVKAGTPIGPTKTHSMSGEVGHDNLELINMDKQGSCIVHGLGEKDYELNQGTLIPSPYEDKYGTLIVSNENAELVPYLKLKRIPTEEVSSLTKQISSCVTAAPILVLNDKELITDTELTHPKYQFPKDGICGPGQLLHGNTPNPRSAIGFNDKEIRVLYAVGINHGVGYKVEGVKGLSLSQLTRLVHRVGMKEALNLDGGGSCFILAEGQNGEKVADYQGKRELSNYIRIDIAKQNLDRNERV